MKTSSFNSELNQLIRVYQQALTAVACGKQPNSIERLLITRENIQRELDFQAAQHEIEWTSYLGDKQFTAAGVVSLTWAYRMDMSNKRVMAKCKSIYKAQRGDVGDSNWLLSNGTPLIVAHTGVINLASTASKPTLENTIIHTGWSETDNTLRCTEARKRLKMLLNAEDFDTALIESGLSQTLTREEIEEAIAEYDADKKNYKTQNPLMKMADMYNYDMVVKLALQSQKAAKSDPSIKQGWRLTADWMSNECYKLAKRAGIPDGAWCLFHISGFPTHIGPMANSNNDMLHSIQFAMNGHIPTGFSLGCSPLPAYENNASFGHMPRTNWVAPQLAALFPSQQEVELQRHVETAKPKALTAPQEFAVETVERVNPQALTKAIDQMLFWCLVLRGLYSTTEEMTELVPPSYLVNRAEVETNTEYVIMLKRYLLIRQIVAAYIDNDFSKMLQVNPTKTMSAGDLIQLFSKNWTTDHLPTVEDCLLMLTPELRDVIDAEFHKVSLSIANQHAANTKVAVPVKEAVQPPVVETPAAIIAPDLTPAVEAAKIVIADPQNNGYKPKAMPGGRRTVTPDKLN